MYTSTLIALIPLLLSSTTAAPAPSVNVVWPHHHSKTTTMAATSADSKSGNSISTGGGFDSSSIDFSDWELQLPVGSAGHPTTISSADLVKGYSDPKKLYYYTDGNALVMKVPGSPDATGCVTTANSKHCRTELREESPASWDPNAATNKLTSTLAVVKADNSAHGTVIGQVHIDDSVSSKPVCELYYSSTGAISMGVEQTRAGGNEKVISVGQVAVGTKFTYEIAYEKNILTVSINGKSTTLSTYSLDAPKSYFKAGNYNQGDDASEVHFFGISTSH